LSADQSALKDFITKEVVTVRKSYGRHDYKGPALASLIGTLNNTSGFLADESGSRRFMICRLESIDLRYQEIDVNQIWAQAVALYREGETWRLLGEEAAFQAKHNERYEVDTVLVDWLHRSFEFDRTYDEPYSLADIIAVLDTDGFRISGTEKQQAMELSRVLKRLGCTVRHTRAGNRWFGLFKKPR
jgi:predicted P-loop ATPase